MLFFFFLFFNCYLQFCSRTFSHHLLLISGFDQFFWLVKQELTIKYYNYEKIKDMMKASADFKKE